jgi:hypothetical protein
MSFFFFSSFLLFFTCEIRNMRAEQVLPEAGVEGRYKWEGGGGKRG